MARRRAIGAVADPLGFVLIAAPGLSSSFGAASSCREDWVCSAPRDQFVRRRETSSFVRPGFVCAGAGGAGPGFVWSPGRGPRGIRPGCQGAGDDRRGHTGGGADDPPVALGAEIRRGFDGESGERPGARLGRTLTGRAHRRRWGVGSIDGMRSGPAARAGRAGGPMVPDEGRAGDTDGDSVMSDARRCPSCGRTRSDDARGETCPACRTHGGTVEAFEPADEAPPTRVTTPPSVAWPETQHSDPEGTQVDPEGGMSPAFPDGARVRYFGDYELLGGDRPRRHGRRLPGPAGQPQPRRRPEDDPGRAAGLARPTSSGSAPRPRRRPTSTTRTSCRSTRSASTRASTTSA